MSLSAMKRWQPSSKFGTNISYFFPLPLPLQHSAHQWHTRPEHKMINKVVSTWRCHHLMYFSESNKMPQKSSRFAKRSERDRRSKFSFFFRCVSKECNKFMQNACHICYSQRERKMRMWLANEPPNQPNENAKNALKQSNVECEDPNNMYLRMFYGFLSYRFGIGTTQEGCKGCKWWVGECVRARMWTTEKSSPSPEMIHCALDFETKNMQNWWIM